MSAVVISSLVRCGEWDRKHEKKDETPQKQGGYEEQNLLDTLQCTYEAHWHT